MVCNITNVLPCRGKLAILPNWIQSRYINLLHGKNEHKKIKSRFALPHLLQEMPFLEQNVQARLDKALSFDINQVSGRVKIDFW